MGIKLIEILEIICIIFKPSIQRIYWFYVNFQSGISRNVSCLSGKTAIVTGGSSGIGFMTSKLLASRGCRVIIACRRNAEKEIEEIKKETNNPNITFKHLDLCQFASVRKFAEEIRKEESKIDILINNAGIGYSDQIATVDGQDVLMQSNFFGHFLLTHLLIDLLRKVKDGRIVFLTSGLAMLHNISRNSLYAEEEMNIKSHLMRYVNSKACAVFITEKMAEKLAKSKIKVNAVDPGTVATSIFDTLVDTRAEMIPFLAYIFHIIVWLLGTDLYDSAQTSLHCAAGKDIGNGLHYFRCKPMFKLKGQTDKNLHEEIWRESEKIVQLRPEERL